MRDKQKVKTLLKGSAHGSKLQPQEFVLAYIAGGTSFTATLRRRRAKWSYYKALRWQCSP